jgi:hypothetical protein
MRRTVSTVALGVVAAVVIGVIATNCGSDTTGPKGKTYVAANMNAAAENGGFTSLGTGTFTFVDVGTEIDWTLNLTNMTGVTLSHIHLGDASATGNNAGPVIINLFLPNGPTATLNGEVAHGSFTSLNNASVSLDSVRVLLNNGHAYANVHTVAHGAGEIRAQIVPQ